jgi:hypothetical protein
MKDPFNPGDVLEAVEAGTDLNLGVKYRVLSSQDGQVEVEPLVRPDGVRIIAAVRRFKRFERLKVFH